MDFHGELRSKFSGAVVRSCEKEQCRLSLASLNPRPTVIDPDKCKNRLDHQGAICDYLVFMGSHKIGVVVVEMKAGAADVPHAVKQLQGGAQIADCITQGRPIKFFGPLLLSERVHPSERKVLANQKVYFRGIGYRVARRRCGAKLLDIIAEFAAD